MASDDRRTRVALVLLPRFNMLSLASAIEPMRVANYMAPKPLYQWRQLSTDGGQVSASNGIAVDTGALPDGPTDLDVAFIFGSWGAEHYSSERLYRWLRLAARRGVRLIGVELGVYMLARAGLMASRAATTHWAWMPGFAEQFPQVQVREQLYTLDGQILTCAGGTAPLDIGLSLMAGRHGDQLTYEVAEQIMHHPVRGPEAPQRHTLGAGTDSIPPDLRAALMLIEQNIEEPLTVPRIAQQAGLSQRQLERLFKRHIGCSVVQFSKLLRLQHARVLLTSTGMSVREVSAATGFNSLSYFSQAFVACFGRKPSEYRQGWPEHEPAPTWPGTVSAFISRMTMPGGAQRH